MGNAWVDVELTDEQLGGERLVGCEQGSGDVQNCLRCLNLLDAGPRSEADRRWDGTPGDTDGQA
jgi:hypothetical protein